MANSNEIEDLLEEAVLKAIKRDIDIQAMRQESGDIDVIAMPSNPEKYECKHQTGACIVAIKGSTYDPALGNFQNQSIEIETTLLLKSKNGHARAHALLGIVRRAVSNISFMGGTIYKKRAGFLDYDEDKGIWYYGLVFGIDLPSYLGE